MHVPQVSNRVGKLHGIAAFPRHGHRLHVAGKLGFGILHDVAELAEGHGQFALGTHVTADCHRCLEVGMHACNDALQILLRVRPLLECPIAGAPGAIDQIQGFVDGGFGHGRIQFPA